MRPGSSLAQRRAPAPRCGRPPRPRPSPSATRCSSTWPGAPRIVVLGFVEARVDGRHHLVDVALGHRRDPQHAAPHDARRRRPAPRSRGSTCSSNIGFISPGGPGSSTSTRPSCSSSCPGAVPRAFGSTSAPSITSACFTFVVGHRPAVAREARAQALDDRRVAAQAARRRPRRPPRASGRPRSGRARRWRSRRRRGRAPRGTRTRGARRRRRAWRAPRPRCPASSSRSVSQSELVSARSGPSSSLPIARISAFTASRDGPDREARRAAAGARRSRPRRRRP